ncbi:MAG: flagellar brake protein [Bacteroidota bacterium]
MKSKWRESLLQPISLIVKGLQVLENRLFALGIVLFWAMPVFSQIDLSRIGWKRAEPEVILTIFSIFFSGLFFLLVLHVRTRSKIKKDALEASLQQFDQMVYDANLTNLEQQRLRSLLEYANVKDLHVIFQSITLYEKCIHSYIKEFTKLSPSQQSIDYEDEILGSVRKKLGYNYLPYEHPLISTRNLGIGQSVSVVNSDNKSVLIQNAVLVKNQEFSFTIQYNTEKEDVVHIASGSPVNIVFTRHSDGAYSVLTEVKNCSSGSIELAHSMSLKRNQLRQHIRIEVNFPLKFRLVKSLNESLKPLYNKICEGRISDISGGGISFLFDKALNPGDKVMLTIPIPDGTITGVSARILRISLVEGKTSVQYKHHAQFMAIDTRDREKIIRFVFEKQRLINQMR